MAVMSSADARAAPSPTSSARSASHAVAMFAANEAALLEPSLRALAAASPERGCDVSLVLNGTVDDSVTRLRAMALPPAMRLRVWLIPRADKANAINAYLHELLPAAPHHVLMDAYVRVEPGAFDALARRLADDPHPHMVCGVPRNGRSAAWMTRRVLAGGIANGNLYALRDDFVRSIADLGCRMPVGFYRGDSLLGSMAATDLDGVRHDWDPTRIAGVVEAGYHIRPLSPLRPGDIRRQLRREWNQTRGLVEMAAARDVLQRGGYGALPRTADELVRTWLEANPPPRPKSLLHRAMLPLVLRRLRGDPRQFAPDELRPTLVLERGG